MSKGSMSCPRPIKLVIPKVSLPDVLTPVPAAGHEETRRSAGLKERLRLTEQQLIYEELQRHPSVRQAAASLKIDHSTLLRKLKKMPREPLGS
ncbi:hypothetical protein ACI7RC_02395 [Brevibacillus sp. B_LB10_24]|uniref:hypothetical protein n=1 Tax=Brevibacillus sp. B_LB10_24 TaxID=3380645 RepID=UPI0038B843C6